MITVSEHVSEDARRIKSRLTWPERCSERGTAGDLSGIRVKSHDRICAASLTVIGDIDRDAGVGSARGERVSVQGGPPSRG